jgi:hypothetical protein
MAAYTALNNRALDTRGQLLSFSASFVVAADHYERHTKVPGDCCTQTDFSKWTSVYEHLNPGL